MNDNNSGLFCALGGWGFAILAGLLGGVMLMVLGDWRLIQAIFAAIVIIILVGAFMTWVVCRPLPEMGATPASRASTNPTPSTSQSARDAAQAAKGGAVATPSAGTPAAAAEAARAQIVPSAPLAGEAELASRKGAWRYEAPTAAAPAAAATPEPKSGDVDYDKDGVIEGKDEGSRPEALSGPRDGQADNLKEIKGIGPKLEKLCNSLGFYHFDQIANWTSDEVAWVDANLEGFKGRVSRDEWVAQAKILADGGETEFSKRVEDGDVY